MPIRDLALLMSFWQEEVRAIAVTARATLAMIAIIFFIVLLVVN